MSAPAESPSEEDLKSPPPTAADSLSLLLIRSKEILLLVGSLATILAIVGGFGVWVIGTAHAQAVEVAEQVKLDAGDQQRRLGNVEKQLDQHIEDEAQARRIMRDDVHEVQLDVRALYKFIQTRQPQERLERAPDAGHH